MGRPVAPSEWQPEVGKLRERVRSLLWKLAERADHDSAAVGRLVKDDFPAWLRRHKWMPPFTLWPSSIELALTQDDQEVVGDTVIARLPSCIQDYLEEADDDE